MVESMDLRKDAITAARVREALHLQREFGYEYARKYLQAMGVNRVLALQVLARRVDRRASAALPVARRDTTQASR